MILTKRQKQTAFIIAVLLSVICVFATDIYLPSMPRMAAFFKVNIRHIEWSIAIYVFGFACGGLFCGVLSDQFGRRIVVIVCLILGAMGGGICCIALSVKWLLFGRAIQGVGLSGTNIISRTILRDTTDTPTELARLSSFLGMLYAVILALAPIIGGYVQKYLVWQVNFIILFMFSVLLCIICIIWLPETNQNRYRRTLRQALMDYYVVASNTRFLMYVSLSALSLTGFLAYQTVAAYLLEVKVGLNPDQFGYTSSLILLGVLVGGYLNGKLVVRRGINPMLKLGAGLFIAAGGFLFVCGLVGYISLFGVLLPVMVYAFATNLVYPNASSGSMSMFATRAGAAAAIYSFCQMLTSSIGSWLISEFHDASQLPLGIMMLSCGVLGLLILKRIHTYADKVEI
jgi:Bcr/CflA subfamily drug resistance transporter